MGFVATGVTLTHDGMAGFFAEVIDVNGPEAAVEAINMSHHGTSNAHAFDPAKLVDWGQLDVTIAFDPATKPTMGVKGTVTLTMANSGAAAWSWTGFLTRFRPGNPLEDRATADVSIKVDGDVTVTP